MQTSDGSSGILNISELMYDNLEYMGKDLPPLIARFNLIADCNYSLIGVAQHAKFIDGPTLDKACSKVEKVNELFDQIVVETLQEATQLAQELKLEPIAEPLLASYLDQKSYRPRLISKLKKVNELFDQIVVETLQEATQLAQELKLEPIAEPLLASYLDQKSYRPRLISKLKSEQ